MKKLEKRIIKMLNAGTSPQMIVGKLTFDGVYNDEVEKLIIELTLQKIRTNKLTAIVTN